MGGNDKTIRARNFTTGRAVECDGNCTTRHGFGYHFSESVFHREVDIASYVYGLDEELRKLGVAMIKESIELIDETLCGYFDSGYLGYEAAEGLDWIWEHRISDMEALGL